MKQNISNYLLYILGPPYLQNYNTRNLGSRARQKYCISGLCENDGLAPVRLDSACTKHPKQQIPPIYPQESPSDIPGQQQTPLDTTRQLQTSGAAVFLGWNQGGAIINKKLSVYKFLLFHAQFFV